MKHSLKIFAITLIALLGWSCQKPETLEQTEAKLSIDQKMVQFSGEKAEKTIALTATGDWSAKKISGSEWCTIDPMSGKGNAEVKISVPANSSERRSTTVTFASKGCKNVTLTVIQNKGDAEPENPDGPTDPDNVDLSKLPAGLSAVPVLPDADEPCTLYYKADRKSPFFDFSGDIYAHIGLLVNGEWNFVQAEWSENIEKCKFKKEKSNVWSLRLEPSVRQYFDSAEDPVGETPLTNIAVVVRASSGKPQSDDIFIQVKDNKYEFVPDEVVHQPVPAGAEQGININADNSVTFVLYDKDKKGKSHDFCYLIGEFSNWKSDSQYIMKRDDASGCWWYTLTGLPAGTHLFQYFIGNQGGNALKLTDPYCSTVYDGWNDKYISSSTYPGLIPFPEKTSGWASAFEIGKQPYNWQHKDFKIKDKNDLVIYELLIRDFEKSGDLNGVMKHMDYLKNLGVNAIELMPIQEFDGNDSWGYNPSHYLALDKAYGTLDMYKAFIDKCHENGIAVIVDVVYNHATGGNPMARLFSEGNKVSADNPWFNQSSPHPFGMFNDWNHESELTREHIKRSLVYLLDEYDVDGFRFDLTKGFTQRQCDESNAGNYDAERIGVLKEYNNAILAANDNAVVILEHFCEFREEKELAEAGMKVWRKMNNPYCQTAMGIKSDSDFNGLYVNGGNNMPFGSCVGFMESHDEERTTYKAKAFGDASIKASLSAQMKRAALNAAFFLTVPGPKMIWQFGELGYDISIDEGGRTAKKPVKWEYYNVKERKQLYDVYATLLKFRKENPEFFRSDATFNWSVGTNNWPGRYILCDAGSKSFAIVGNFGTTAANLNIGLHSAGTWYDYFDRSKTYQGQNHDFDLQPGEFKMLVNF